jgi:hypothetical protein
MAALELEGKISLKQAVQSGQSARGPWAKQEFILEYMDGNFPTSVCFTAWGDDKVNELARFQVGDKVKVSFNIKGREYNGRWYNDLRIWKISSADTPSQHGASTPAATSAPQGGSYGVRPQEAPAPTFEDIPAADGTEEDLPF